MLLESWDYDFLHPYLNRSSVFQIATIIRTNLLSSSFILNAKKILFYFCKICDLTYTRLYVRFWNTAVRIGKGSKCEHTCNKQDREYLELGWDACCGVSLSFDSLVYLYSQVVSVPLSNFPSYCFSSFSNWFCFVRIDIFNHCTTLCYACLSS